MKTQKNKLVFKTVSILELENESLQNINGGSTMICSKDSGIACLIAYMTF